MREKELTESDICELEQIAIRATNQIGTYFALANWQWRKTKDCILDALVDSHKPLTTPQKAEKE